MGADASPEGGRRGLLRLLGDMERVAALQASRRPARERVARELGAECARRLVDALVGCRSVGRLGARPVGGSCA